MKEYLNVKWKNDVVGTVYINEEGMYKYFPRLEIIEKLSNEGMPSVFVINKQEEWKDNMPIFIENRLKLNPQGIVATDYFSFEKVEN